MEMFVDPSQQSKQLKPLHMKYTLLKCERCFGVKILVQRFLSVVLKCWFICTLKKQGLF